MDIIETKRLLLRPFNPKDMEAIYQVFSCEKVNTYLPWLPLKSKSEATTFYEEKLTGLNDTQYAICLKEDDIPIGYINISLKEPYDLGYGLLPSHWRQGIVTEAGRAVIEQIRLSKIPYLTATHDVNNQHSGYVMKSLGMTYQYTYRELWQPKNKLVDFRLYQLNFTDNDFVYDNYRNKSTTHYIEPI